MALDPLTTGLREYYQKGTKEEPFHMSSVLRKLYPNNEFLHDKGVKDPNGHSYRSQKGGAFRPDFHNDDLKIIIEVDGDGGRYSKHFSDSNQCLRDIEKQMFFEKLGYKVIRIPMYIQLDEAMIKYYFGIDYTETLYPAANCHGFYHPEITLPAKFCKEGIERFKREMSSIPISVKDKIIESLKGRIKEEIDKGKDEETAKSSVLPRELYSLLDEHR